MRSDVLPQMYLSRHLNLTIVVWVREVDPDGGTNVGTLYAWNFILDTFVNHCANKNNFEEKSRHLKFLSCYYFFRILTK